MYASVLKSEVFSDLYYIYIYKFKLFIENFRVYIEIYNKTITFLKNYSIVDGTIILQKTVDTD